MLLLLLILHTQVFKAEGQGEKSGSSSRQGKRGHIEIFTYSQTDFLALSA